MELNLHANATTTPKTRAYIQSSPKAVAALATKLGKSKTTIRRWKNRDSVEDRSHRPSGNHPVDRLCSEHQIEHKLTRPYHPQTNGMVERFNRRISEHLAARPQKGPA